MKCPICGNSKHIKKGVRFDDRYGYRGTFPLLGCNRCGHTYLKADLSPSLLKDLYSKYYPRSTFDLESHHPYQEYKGFRAWLDGARSSAFRWVPLSVRVLDVGCGYGESLGYHKSRGCDVYGVEVDENIKRVAKKYGYNVHVGLFDPNLYKADYFDYVTMSQVIEHVSDPVQTLCGIARILKPGGVTILSTPNANGWGIKVFGWRWINWHAPYHLQFFTNESMCLAAKQAGLTMEESVTITPSAWLSYQWMHLITYPQEGEPSVFWAPGSHWRPIQKILRMVLRIVNYTGFNHVVTRAFDVLRLGDNRIYVLRKP